MESTLSRGSAPSKGQSIVPWERAFPFNSEWTIEGKGISREKTMENTNSMQGRPDPGRLELVRNLPKEVLQSLTKEEIRALLHDEEWPDSLQEKLKEYAVK